MVARVVNLKLVFKFDHTGQVIKNPIPKLRESCIITNKPGYLFEHWGAPWIFFTDVTCLTMFEILFIFFRSPSCGHWYVGNLSVYLTLG